MAEAAAEGGVAVSSRGRGVTVAAASRAKPPSPLGVFLAEGGAWVRNAASKDPHAPPALGVLLAEVPPGAKDVASSIKDDLGVVRL